MTRARPGHLVEIRYQTRYPDGTVIGDADQAGAIEAKLGAGELPKPLEDLLVGMCAGERKTTRLGPLARRRADLVHQVRLQDLPSRVKPRVGETLRIDYASGRTRRAAIVGVRDAIATLDANHPLADRELVLDVELLSIT